MANKYRDHRMNNVILHARDAAIGLKSLLDVMHERDDIHIDDFVKMVDGLLHNHKSMTDCLSVLMTNIEKLRMVAEVPGIIHVVDLTRRADGS